MSTVSCIFKTQDDGHYLPTLLEKIINTIILSSGIIIGRSQRHLSQALGTLSVVVTGLQNRQGNHFRNIVDATTNEKLFLLSFYLVKISTGQTPLYSARPTLPTLQNFNSTSFNCKGFATYSKLFRRLFHPILCHDVFNKTDVAYAACWLRNSSYQQQLARRRRAQVRNMSAQQGVSALACKVASTGLVYNNKNNWMSVLMPNAGVTQEYSQRSSQVHQ